MQFQEATLEFCPMQKDINKQQSSWLRERELAVQGEVEGAGLVWLGGEVWFLSLAIYQEGTETNSRR